MARRGSIARGIVGVGVLASELEKSKRQPLKRGVGVLLKLAGWSALLVVAMIILALALAALPGAFTLCAGLALAAAAVCLSSLWAAFTIEL